MDNLILKSLLSEKERKELVEEFNNFDKKKSDRFAKENVPNSRLSVLYHNKFKNLVQEVVGEDIKCLYTYMRKYTKGAELIKHTDKNEIYYTLSIQVDKSDNIPNPLILHYDDENVELNLENGDGALILKGFEIPHSRPILESEYMYQLFLFYYPLKKSLI